MMREALVPEQSSFYARAIAAGAKSVIERTLLVGHVDTVNGNVYFPNSMPRRANGLRVPTEIAEPVHGSSRPYYSPDRTPAADQYWSRLNRQVLVSGIPPLAYP